MVSNIKPTGVERFFGEEEIIVSKTDLKGRITYANQVFIKISGYREEELLGEGHNIIRHPAMPRCVFKLLWDTIESGREIFAYVNNLSKNGDNYWVHAHVTPTFGADGQMTGYHSNRRVPDRKSVAAAAALYVKLLAEEKRHADWRQGMEAATAMLHSTIANAGKEYDEFVFSL
jgi:PAS domain S-box-containing protein